MNDYTSIVLCTKDEETYPLFVGTSDVRAALRKWFNDPNLEIWVAGDGYECRHNNSLYYATLTSVKLW